MSNEALEALDELYGNAAEFDFHNSRKLYKIIEQALQPKAVEWECFCDEAYYHKWAVRPKGDKSFSSQQLFHVGSKEEAEALRDTLQIK